MLAAGSETPRDLPIPGRELKGVHAALEFLIPQNRQIAGGKANPINAKACRGDRRRRHGVGLRRHQLPPSRRVGDPARIAAKAAGTGNKATTWPYWPLKLRTPSSHLEGETQRHSSVATKEFIGEKGILKAIRTIDLEWKDGKMSEAAGSERVLPADLVFLAMGFVSPLSTLLESFGVDKDVRGIARAATDGPGCYATSAAKVFAAGDVRRGQSLVVWAIREGRQCAREVDVFLMGSSSLPR